MATQSVRDLTTKELVDIQKNFPLVKNGDYAVLTMFGEAYLGPKTRAGNKPASNNPPEMPEKGSL